MINYKGFFQSSKIHEFFKNYNLTLLLVQLESLDIMDFCEDKDIEVNLYN